MYYKVKLELSDGSSYEIKGLNADSVWEHVANIRERLDELGFDYKVYKKRIGRWKRHYTINDLKFED